MGVLILYARVKGSRVGEAEGPMECVRHQLIHSLLCLSLNFKLSSTGSKRRSEKQGLGASTPFWV